MYQSPRIRRLHNDLAALERLRLESSVFRFTAKGDPPQQYLISFKGTSLWRRDGHVRTLDLHHVEIKLGASYPRTIPELRWMTPIFHPNISEIGLVCLGGYGTHWVPSIQIDELCGMLWDMARYHNYDIRSPYNRDAALWVANQTKFLFPTDSRPIRDLRAALGRIASPAESSDRAKSTVPVVENEAGKRSKTRALEFESSNQVRRVRQFVARYGRVFGNAEAIEPRQPEPCANLDTEVPELIDRPLPPASSAMADHPAASLEGLVILDDSHTVQPQTVSPRSAGDDIFFIE